MSGREKEGVKFCSQSEENGNENDENGGQIRWRSVLVSGVVVVKGKGLTVKSKLEEGFGGV